MAWTFAPVATIFLGAWLAGKGSNDRKELLMALNEYRRDHDKRMAFWLAVGLLVAVIVLCAIFL